MKDACTDVDTASGEHCEVIECLEAITALAEGAEGDCAEHLPENTAVGLRAVAGKCGAPKQRKRKPSKEEAERPQKPQKEAGEKAREIQAALSGRCKGISDAMHDACDAFNPGEADHCHSPPCLEALETMASAAAEGECASQFGEGTSERVRGLLRLCEGRMGEDKPANICEASLVAMQDDCEGVDTTADEHCSSQPCLAAMRGMLAIGDECTEDWGAETAPAIATLVDACGGAAGGGGEAASENTAACDATLEAMQTACEGIDVEGEDAGYCGAAGCVAAMAAAAAMGDACEAGWGEGAGAAMGTLAAACPCEDVLARMQEGCDGVDVEASGSRPAPARACACARAPARARARARAPAPAPAPAPARARARAHARLCSAAVI